MKRGKWKSLGACLLALTLVASSLSGCGKKELTLEDILASVKENTEKAEGMSGDLAMTMEAEISASGMSLEMGIEMLVDMETSKKDEAELAPLEGSMKATAMGQEQNMEVEAYAVSENGKVRSYSCTDGVWTYSEDASEGFGELTEMADMYKSADNWTLAEEKADRDGTSCYVLEGSISGDAMSAMAELTGEMGLGDLSDASLPFTMYVDADKLLPVSIAVEGTEMMRMSLFRSRA